MSKGLDALKRYRDIPTTMDYDIIEQELEAYQEIQTYMQQYEISEIEELRRTLHNDWVIRQKFKTDTANVAKALEIIKEKRVDVAELVVSCDLKAYNYLFRLVEKWQLTQEEYDLLKEVLV